MELPRNLDVRSLGVGDQPLPRFASVRQSFRDDSLPDAGLAVREALDRSRLHDRLPTGGRIAITAGSRGIDRIAEATRAVVDWVRAAGCEPFVVPAMGSHGGATAEGQLQVLASLGLDETSLGCPIVSSMEAREIGVTPRGYRVYCDAAALAADGILVVNRVKPHSILVGNLGSGLMKMAGVGLGKQLGADSIHQQGLQEHMLDSARLLLARAPVLGGVAFVENSLDKIAVVEAVPAEAMEEADERLLAVAQSYLPNVPFDPLDVLIVVRIGKNISGAGMDPNVIGMHRRIGGSPSRHIGRIVALDLTPESHGNGIGIGVADVVTERLRDAVDWEATYVNAATSDFLWGVKAPLALPTDDAALRFAFKPYPPARARSVLVRDTAHLELMYVSEALESDISAHPAVERVGDYRALEFDGAGRLVAFE